MTTTTNAAPARDGRPDWLPEELWPFQVRWYEHEQEGRDPLRIHYVDEGRGPTIVFVHAGMWSFVWRDVIRALAADFRCITLDFPGAGLSDGTGRDIDLGGFPAIVDGVLEHCGVDRSTFVVHDLGGVVGVLAAANRADRVDGLVATNAFAWPPDRFALTAMLRVMGGTVGTYVLGNARLIPRLSRTDAGVGRNLDPDDRRAFFGPYRCRSHARNFHRVMGSAAASAELFAEAKAALSTSLADVALYTVFGEKNDPFGFADRWKELFPTARQWVVPGGNHFPMCDAPTEYAARLAEWHREVVAPAALAAVRRS